MDGRSCPIDARDLPTPDGAGLTYDELARVNAARNAAIYEYGVTTPEDAWTGEGADAAGRAAAAAALTGVLRERAPAGPSRVPLVRREGCCVTPGEAIAAAAAAGIRLVQPRPESAWLTDAAGRPVFWWAAGPTLYLRAY
jgi:hypothetical protein